MDDLPSQTDVEFALWNLMKHHAQGITAQHAYDILADRFELTYEQVHRKTTASSEPAWPYRVRQAHRALKDKGVADRGERNQWELTVFGKTELNIDLDELGL